MKIKNLNNTAFTLLEVLMASIIFVITIGGLFATLNAVRAPVIQKENDLAAAIVGQQVLNYLRSQVNTSPASYYNPAVWTTAAPCTTLDLELGPHAVPMPVTVAGGTIAYPANSNLQALNGNVLNYTVTCADGTTTTCNTNCVVGCNLDQARQVTLSITNSSP